MARCKTVLGVDHPDTLLSLWGVAQDLIKLDRGADAVPLLDECLQRAVGKRVHRNFPEVADFRLRYFERAKNAQECRRTAELWEKQGRSDVKSLYQAAVCRAVTSAMLKETNAPVLAWTPSLRARPTGRWPGSTRLSPQAITMRPD